MDLLEAFYISKYPLIHKAYRFIFFHHVEVIIQFIEMTFYNQVNYLDDAHTYMRDTTS